MQIGFVGLGKMGGNMVARIKRDSDHEVVAFDFDAQGASSAARKTRRARRHARCATSSRSSTRRGTVWIMVPAGEATQKTVDELAKLLDRGDTIVDGGNSKWTDDKARAEALRKQGIHYVDVGTSGGVWGLEVGYCMMVGGPHEAVKRLAPILDVLAPAADRASTARAGGTSGPTGAGPLREDGPQRRSSTG